jgi:hypothetical protein
MLAPIRHHAPAGSTAAAPSTKQRNGRSTRGASDQGAPGSFDGRGTGGDPQAQGLRARKRCAVDAAAAAATADTDDAFDSGSDAPPAKKGRGQSHGQLPAKTKSSFRCVYPAHRSGLWNASGELMHILHHTTLQTPVSTTNSYA